MVQTQQTELPPSADRVNVVINGRSAYITTNDDSNCLNSVHASASANTNASYSLLKIAHLSVAAMRTQVDLSTEY